MPAARRDIEFLETTDYIGTNGTVVHLRHETTPGRRPHTLWWWSEHGSAWEYGPFDEKILALTHCANMRGLAGAAMDWTPRVAT